MALLGNFTNFFSDNEDLLNASVTGAPAKLDATNGAAVNLTRALAAEWGRHDINVNAICPGFVKTPLVEKQITDLAKQKNISEAEVIQKNILQKHAVKNFVSPEEIAALALFLASENASMITGTSMPVDGGWTAQ